MFQRQGFTVTLMVNGKPCSGLLDTGATRTILTDDVVAATRPSNRVLRAYNGGDIETLGMADVRIGTEDQQRFVVSVYLYVSTQHILTKPSESKDDAQHLPLHLGVASLNICQGSAGTCYW